MPRSSHVHGFVSRAASVASPRLIDAVAASLAFGVASLCLVLAVTVLSLKTGGLM